MAGDSADTTGDEFALFLDTNSLLHYPALKETDWKAVCDCKRVRLVFCLQVISELDSKKDDSRLGDRARKRIKELRELRRSDDELQDGVSVEVFNQPLRSEDFQATLSYEAKDDRIVHCVLLFGQQHPQVSVAVYSEDMGMALRCEAHSITIIEPDSDKRLSNPESEQQKKHQLAVTELAELKNRVPVVELIVTGTHVTNPVKELTAFEVTGDWEEHDVATELKRYVAENNLEPMQKKEIAGGDGLIPTLPANNDAVERYNDKLSEHIKEYSEWLQHRALLEKVHAHVFKFQIWLKNTGKAPADDLDLVIDVPSIIVSLFPEDCDDADQLSIFDPPVPPKRPTQFFGDFGRIAVDRILNPELTMPNMDRMFNRQATVEKGEDGQSFRIRYSTNRLKHHEVEDCGTIIAVISPDSIRPFEMSYRMTAANLPTPVQGKIPMIVNKSAKPTS